MVPRLRRHLPVVLVALSACGFLGDEGNPDGTPDDSTAVQTGAADPVVADADTAAAVTDSVDEALVQVPDSVVATPAGQSTAAGATPTDSLGFLLMARLDSVLVAQSDIRRRLDSLDAAPRAGNLASDTVGSLAASQEVLGQAGRSVQSFGIAAVMSILVVILFNLLIRGSVWLLDALAERNAARRLFYKRLVPITRIVLWIFAAYLIVRVIFRIDAQGLFAAAAAVGVAVGFAAQDLLKNLFGGIILVFDQPFQVGDKVKVGETYGEVVSIGLRSTRIVTPDDNLVSVPNAQVVDQQVANANAGELNCQVVTDLYLPGWADEETAKRIAFQAAASSKYVYLNKPIVVLVADVFKETFLTRVRVKAYVLDPRFEFLLQSDITERARAGFREAGLLRIEHQNTYLVEQALAQASVARVSEARASGSAPGQSTMPGADSENGGAR